MSLTSGLFTSASCDWATPQEVFDSLDREFRFTLDSCASPGNAKCARYYSSEDWVSALALPWQGVVFCNPPYGRRIGQWVEKGARSAEEGATVVMLLPSRTDTQWWHRWVMKASEIRFIEGRLRFGNAANAAPFPSAIVVFRPAADNGGRGGEG